MRSSGAGSGTSLESERGAGAGTRHLANRRKGETARAFAPGLGPGQRQRQRELAPHTRPRVDRDVSTVPRRDLLAQEQPETRAPDAEVLLRRKPAETREQKRHVLARHPQALVAHADERMSIAAPRGD